MSLLPLKKYQIPNTKNYCIQKTFFMRYRQQITVPNWHYPPNNSVQIPSQYSTGQWTRPHHILVHLPPECSTVPASEAPGVGGYRGYRPGEEVRDTSGELAGGNICFSQDNSPFSIHSPLSFVSIYLNSLSQRLLDWVWTPLQKKYHYLQG